MEIDGGDRINFLDVNVDCRERGKIKFDLYKKSTDSGRYLNFYYNHSTQNTKKVLS